MEYFLDGVGHLESFKPHFKNPPQSPFACLWRDKKAKGDGNRFSLLAKSVRLETEGS